jgi:hypothetical protein
MAAALLHDETVRRRAVFRTTGKRWLRGLTGLVVAYALVLQALMASVIVTQAAAQDPSTDAAGFFIICSQHTGTADDGLAGDSGPAKPLAHCPICTLASSHGILLPEPMELPSVQTGVTRRLSFVSADACISFHRARAGLSRAPPQNA